MVYIHGHFGSSERKQHPRLKSNRFPHLIQSTILGQAAFRCNPTLVAELLSSDCHKPCPDFPGHRHRRLQLFREDVHRVAHSVDVRDLAVDHIPFGKRTREEQEHQEYIPLTRFAT